MGRPACSSCCKVQPFVPTKKKGCRKEDFKVYYKYGAGGWKTSDEYNDYLNDKFPKAIEVGINVYHPPESAKLYTVTEIVERGDPDNTPTKVEISNEETRRLPTIISGSNVIPGEDVEVIVVDVSEIEPIKRGGFKGLEEIKYVSSKSDYGEYAVDVNCWDYPMSFYDASKTTEEINEEFLQGNPDYGVHVPKFWTITLGGGDMVIVKKLERLDSYVSYIEDSAVEANSMLGGGVGLYDPYSTDGTGTQRPGSANWYKVITNQLALVDPTEDVTVSDNWSSFMWGGGDDNTRKAKETDIQLKRTTHSVVWTTEILYKGETIFKGSNCFPYKKEYEIYNFGEPPTEAEAPALQTLGRIWTDKLFTFYGDGIGARDGRHPNPNDTGHYGILIPVLDDHIYFHYCLTFPFFSFGENTHYFYEGPDCDFISAPEGTIDEDLDGKLELYHADKSLFTKISVESKDFIVFNPYTGGLGRDITPDELAEYDDPRLDYKHPVDSEHYYGGRIKIRRQTSNQYIYQENEVLQERDYLLKSSRDGKIHARTRAGQEGFTGTPYFQYTDNKINLISDFPQELTIEEEPIGDSIEFPEGWPGDYDPPEGVKETFAKYAVGNSIGDTSSAEDGPDTEYIDDVIFVSFRNKRPASESETDIEEGMEVYHPVGSDDPDDKYTIKEILETGPDLKPTKVRIEKDGVDDKIVDVSDIELVDDSFYYAMNGRTYYLQTIYLKALGGDFYNPFKYRVTRIDFTNPDIDIDCVGNEIAGNPEMLDIELGIKVLYPIGQVDDDGDAIVPDEYTVAGIVARGQDGKPTEIRLSNPLAGADGNVVDVSEIELINPNENPTYITMTTEYSWGKVPEDKKKEGLYMKLSMEENGEEGAEDGMDGMGGMGEGGGEGGGGGDGTITLEQTKNPPMDLKDDIVLTAPPSMRKVWNSEKKEYVRGNLRFVKAGASIRQYTDEQIANFGPNFELLRHMEARQKLNVQFLDNYKAGQGGKEWDFDKKEYVFDDDTQIEFVSSQLPQSGYFFGNFVNLKFYLQEIEEWKKEQKQE